MDGRKLFKGAHAANSLTEKPSLSAFAVNHNPQSNNSTQQHQNSNGDTQMNGEQINTYTGDSNSANLSINFKNNGVSAKAQQANPLLSTAAENTTKPPAVNPFLKKAAGNGVNLG